MTIDEIVKTFSFLDDWEEKYKYLIELGDTLPVFPEDLKLSKNEVQGCMSRVWMICDIKDDKFFFRATSDALIVKGLIALILSTYNGKTKSEIGAIEIHALFQQLGLESHLSPIRRNGFFSMIGKIQEYIEQN